MTAGNPSQGPGPIPQISPSELKERMERSDSLVLIDVREPWEAEIADLPEYGQVRMPLGQLVQQHDQLDRGAEIVLYCRSGGRSDSAAQLLRHRGFDNVWNKGESQHLAYHRSKPFGLSRSKPRYSVPSRMVMASGVV